VILAAIREALEHGIVLNGHTEIEIRLARAIQTRFPSLERMRFTNSGTEANLMALALAVVHTARRTVLVFDGGYHGGVLYFGGGGSPVNVPHRFVLAAYNDVQAAQALAQEHAHDLAAILVEPMLGSSGCIPGSAAFLQSLRDMATRTGALLIFDEVMTSRLAPNGLQGEHGIRPDLTTLGKYLGGGLSFGAFGGRADIMQRFDPGQPHALPHAGTFNNNVLSMTAGFAGLTQVFTLEACEALNATGDRLRERLNASAQARKARLQFTGRGSMMTFHVRREPIRNAADAAKADADLKELIFLDLLERGFWLARRGMINLSLTLNDDDLERFVLAFDAVLEQRAALLV
jgi:glutamate-1-semialdehyde 2,1-aminomutase